MKNLNMNNRINQWIKCDHYNWYPFIYISGTIYIFYCPDCDKLILRDMPYTFKKEIK